METRSTGTLEISTDEIDRRLIKGEEAHISSCGGDRRRNCSRRMGTLSVAAGATQAQANTVVPEHFGGPVYTSIYSPTATLGMPTLSSSSTDTPIPMSAPG
jgi:hypothetical protein